MNVGRFSYTTVLEIKPHLNNYSIAAVFYTEAVFGKDCEIVFRDSFQE